MTTSSNSATSHPGEQSPACGTTALIITDLQPDFLPGGALAVDEGDCILGGVATLLKSGRFDTVVATQDWHPPGHISFASSHQGGKPMDTIDLYGHPQVLWPDHCVQGTAGAELSSHLSWHRADLIIRKATDRAVDSYSAFRDNWGPEGHRPRTGLAGLLRERRTRNVFICGLARDYCVRWSAEDAVDAGFETTVVWDLTRPVDADTNDATAAALRAKGVTILTSDEIR